MAGRSPSLPPQMIGRHDPIMPNVFAYQPRPASQLRRGTSTVTASPGTRSKEVTMADIVALSESLNGGIHGQSSAASGSNDIASSQSTTNVIGANSTAPQSQHHPTPEHIVSPAMGLPSASFCQEILEFLTLFKRLSAGGNCNGFIIYHNSTPSTFNALNALLLRPDLPPDATSIIASSFLPVLKKLGWRFDDTFAMIDFLGAHPRSKFFNTQGMTWLSIAEPWNGNRDCCSLTSRESQCRCMVDTRDDCLICTRITTLPPGFDDDPFDINEPSTQLRGYDVPSLCFSPPALNRTACPHSQRNRIFQLLAAHTPQFRNERGKLCDPSKLEDVARFRRVLMDLWRKEQEKHGWSFKQARGDFPPKGRNRTIEFTCESTEGEKAKMKFGMVLTRHDDGAMVLTYSFIGQMELLI